jgi:hypothetical protein
MKKLVKIRPKIVAVFVAVLFAVSGFLHLNSSSAATFVAKSEAEAGNVQNPAVVSTDALASGGSAVRFSAATKTPPPISTATWPSGWDDPRFDNNIMSGPKSNVGSSMVTWQNLTVNDTSGQPSFGYGNYSLLNTRLRSREGPRISGSNILIQDTYIEVSGSGDDHGDGIQAYGSTSGSNYNFRNVVVKRTKVVLSGSALNAGIFLADRAGVDLTLDTVFIDGGPAPNGALFFANSADGSDKGCNSLVMRHVRVKPSVRFEGLDSCNIVEWTDVAYENGVVIPRP